MGCRGEIPAGDLGVSPNSPPIFISGKNNMRRQVTLLQRFSVLTLMTTVVISVLLGYQVTSSIQQTALDRARNDLAEAVYNRKPFWLTTGDPKAALSRLHSNPEEWNAWNASVDN